MLRPIEVADRKFSRVEIAAVFGVPVEMLGLPSEHDLDAIAEEEKIRQATEKKP